MQNNNLLRDLENLATWMDAKFVIPGTNIRFGLDSLIGLVPGIGDTMGLFVSGYIVHRAMRYDLPNHIKISMILNILIDWILGSIPVIGDMFDVEWKANLRNVDLLKRHLRGQ